MPILMRNKDGQSIEVADEDVKFYVDRGYEPETSFGAVARAAATPEDGGALGAANAGARSFWSGLTLGASDIASSALSTDAEREQIRAERAAHPIASGAGEIAGLVAPAILTGGASLPESGAGLGARALASTPAGYLGRFAAEGATAGRAIGGLEGAAKIAAYSGLEGAGQAAGSYVSEVALGDRDLTAEGLAGALGHGFAFGAAAGTVVHGIERGTIAVRRLFARTAEGGKDAALTAEQELARSTQTTLEAQEAAAEAARAQLATARQAREAADLASQKTHADLLQVKNDLREIEGVVQRGVPDHAALAAHLDEIRAPAITQTIPTDELFERGIINDTAFRWGAISGTSDLPTLLSVSPSGKVVIRARPESLKAAFERGEPVRVNWTVGREPHPLAEAISTSGLGAEAKAAKLLDETKAKIMAGQVPDELGHPTKLGQFTPEGLDAAAKREIGRAARQEADLVAALKEYDAAKVEMEALGRQTESVPRARRATKAQVEEPKAAEIPESPESPLEQQLAAMKTQLDSGADIGTLSRTRTASPRSPEQIETAYEEAIQRADAAKDVGEKQMHLREAAALEEQLKQTPRGRSVVDDVGDMAPVLTRYERAAARVTELAGESAPEAARAHAAAFRAAESDAERKTMDRTARAIDDATNPLISPEGSLAKARSAKSAAEIELARARVAESEASIGARAAEDAAKSARSAFEAAQPAPPEPGLFGQLAGFPEAHAIPIIGPMLNRYAQSKLLQETAKRFVGRVPATATGKAVALAARVRDKIASAVDRSLGLIERTAPATRQPAVAVLGVLERRAFDDGSPGASKGASATKLAAVRIREVAAAATQPDRVIAQVRREMRDVTDPDLIAAAEKHRVAMYQYLNDNAPKGPPPNPYTKREWEPSPAEALRFARRLEVANDPVAAFEALHQQSLTTEAAETLRAVWPKLFGEAQQRLVSRAQDIKHPVAYDQLLRNSLLFDVPLHPSLEPENAFVLRSAFAPIPPTPGPMTSQQPPVPSIAGNTNLSAMFTDGMTRRAGNL